MCVGVPAATGPACSVDGEGGGEGGKLAESSTAKGEREKERQQEDKTWMGGRTQQCSQGVFMEALTTEEIPNYTKPERPKASAETGTGGRR